MERAVTYLHVCAGEEKMKLLLIGIKKKQLPKRKPTPILHIECRIPVIYFQPVKKDLNEYKLRYLYILSGKVINTVHHSTAHSRVVFKFK